MFTKSFALLAGREKPCRRETFTRMLIRLVTKRAIMFSFGDYGYFFTKIHGHGLLKII